MPSTQSTSTQPDTPTVVLLQLSAPWSARCPEFTRAMPAHLADRNMRWLWLDVGEDREIVEAYNVQRLPTVLLFDVGECSGEDVVPPRARLEGARHEDLLALLDEHCPRRLRLDEDF